MYGRIYRFIISIIINLIELHSSKELISDKLKIFAMLINLSKPTGHVMHQQFNIQQLYVLPTLYLCVLYLSENKQRLFPYTALTDWFL